MKNSLLIYAVMYSIQFVDILRASKEQYEECQQVLKKLIDIFKDAGTLSTEIEASCKEYKEHPDVCKKVAEHFCQMKFNIYLGLLEKSQACEQLYNHQKRHVIAGSDLLANSSRLSKDHSRIQKRESYVFFTCKKFVKDEMQKLNDFTDRKQKEMAVCQYLKDSTSTDCDYCKAIIHEGKYVAEYEHSLLDDETKYCYGLEFEKQTSGDHVLLNHNEGVKFIMLTSIFYILCKIII